jgi:hypothetical protein
MLHSWLCTKVRDALTHFKVSVSCSLLGQDERTATVLNPIQSIQLYDAQVSNTHDAYELYRRHRGADLTRLEIQVRWA